MIDPQLLGSEKWGAWWDAEKEPGYVCSYGRAPETFFGGAWVARGYIYIGSTP